MPENVTAYAPYDSEGKRMPVACPVDCLYDETGYHVLKRRGRYSSEEVKTGETWIDGRPIYRKVFEKSTTLPVSGVTTLVNDEEISASLDMAVLYKIMLFWPATICFQNLPFFTSGILYTDQYYKGRGIEIFASRINGSEALSTKFDFLIIVEYIKTTDTPEVSAHA